MGRHKGSKGAGKASKVQGSKFVQYQVDFDQHPDNVYRVHLRCNGLNRFGLGSWVISMALKTGDDFIYHTC